MVIDRWVFNYEYLFFVLACVLYAKVMTYMALTQVIVQRVMLITVETTVPQLHKILNIQPLQNVQNKM